MEFENQYLTYKEYQALGGTLAETPFNILEYQAQKIIDKYTFGRLIELETQSKDVKLCVVHLLTVIEGYDALEKQKRGVSSENTDGYSVSYGDISSVVNSKAVELKNIVLTDLAECKLENNVPYLYIGADK